LTTLEQADPEVLAAFRRDYARRLKERAAAMQHPAGLLEHVKCIDSKTGERFAFTLNDPDAGWYWQRAVLDSWIGHRSPRAQGAADRDHLARRRLRALEAPDHAGHARPDRLDQRGRGDQGRQPDLRHVQLAAGASCASSAKITKPTRGARPTTLIEFTFPDGRHLLGVGLPSTRRAGHGEVATRSFCSTSTRGMSTPATLGRRCSRPPTTAGRSSSSRQRTASRTSRPARATTSTTSGSTPRQLRDRPAVPRLGSLHPDRDEHWYETNARAACRRLDRAEQFPLSRGCVHQHRRVLVRPRGARLVLGERIRSSPSGASSSSPTRRAARRRSTRASRLDPRLREARPEHTYAIGADVATGRGLDYSCAYVIDLQTMELAPSSTRRSTPTSSPSSCTSSVAGTAARGSRSRWAAATASP
jgi:hypothetical protein